MRIVVVVSALTILGVCLPAIADETQELTHAQAKQLYKDGAIEGVKGELTELTIGDDKLRVRTCPVVEAPRSIPGPNRTTFSTVIKIWGEVSEGPDKGLLVNLQKYKWQKSQKFHLHVSSAFPVSMAVFQTFPDDRPDTKQVSPTRAVPSTFSVIPAAQDYRMPFEFVTDDDLRDEIVQFVFVRADSRSCPLAPLVRGDVVVKSVQELDDTVTKGFAQLTKAAKGDPSAKLGVVHPLERMPPTSTRPDDVSIIMAGPGVAHLGQVTLNK